nr:PRC-barrel domain containing protein [Allocatelliglobosispora scoriae]
MNPIPAWDPWNYRDLTEYKDDAHGEQGERDLVGFHVEATDGSIGKIDEATYETNSSYVVVDTGPWIFGTKVMLPAGVIDNIDVVERKVFVHRTKDQIKDAPRYDPESRDDEIYRKDLGSYYEGGTRHDGDVRL